MASTPLFFVTRDSIENDRVVITGADASHIVRVLRLREGAPLLVSDMQRNEYTVTITCASPQRVECAILSRRVADTESPYRITLYQAFPKADKLGAAEVVPVLSERCVSRPDAKSMENRLTRLNRIARAAAEQSGRGVLPVVSPPVPFPQMLEGLLAADLGFACYEGEREYKLRDLLADVPQPRTIAFPSGCSERNSAPAARAYSSSRGSPGRALTTAATCGAP